MNDKTLNVTPPREGVEEGFGSAIRTVARADSAVGRGLSAAGHFAARVAQRHPAAAIGAIGGAVLGHKTAQGIDKNLPDGQHLTRGAKARWAASGAVAGAAAGAGAALADRIKRRFEGVVAEDSYYVGYHPGGKKEVFRSPTIPDGYSHPKYGHVEGPYASAMDAHHAAVQESVVAILNAEIARINEGDSSAASSRPRDSFTTYPSAKEPPGKHPDLASAIRRSKWRDAYSTDVVAQTARGEVPLGHVDDEGFHYLKLGLRPHRIPEASHTTYDLMGMAEEASRLAAQAQTVADKVPITLGIMRLDFAARDMTLGDRLQGLASRVAMSAESASQAASRGDFAACEAALARAKEYFSQQQDLLKRDESLTFAARPMSFVGRVKEKIQEIEILLEKEKWVQNVHPKKGALRKQLNIPQGKNIPTSTLRAATKKGGLLSKRANLALRYRGESS